MSIVDAFAKEDRVEVKFSDFYNLMKEATKAELLTNGINCETPHAYMREIMTGKREEDVHTHSDMTIHINSIISGIDMGSGEDEPPFPWETPGQEESIQEPEGTQEDTQGHEPDPWEDADNAGAVEQTESEG